MLTVTSPLNVANDRATKHNSARFRLVAAFVVTAAHAALISLLMRQVVDQRKLELSAEPMLAEIIGAQSTVTPAPTSPAPVALPIELSLPSLPVETQVQTAAIDAPKIDPAAAIDAAPYEARAELAPGTVATVILLLEIAPDGSVLSAQVVRSNSGDAANAAALDYARATRWTAGLIDGEPRAMQASLTVILGERG